MKNLLSIISVALASIFLFSSPAHAIDVSAVVTELQTDGTAAITAVGVALLGLAGIAVVIKWVKAAFFS